MSKKTALLATLLCAVTAAVPITIAAWLANSFGFFDQGNELGVAKIRTEAAATLQVNDDQVTVEKLVDWPACVTATAYHAAQPGQKLAYKAKRVAGSWEIRSTSEVQDFDDNYSQSVCLER